jgi:hypothetical protein
LKAFSEAFVVIINNPTMRKILNIMFAVVALTFLSSLSYAQMNPPDTGKGGHGRDTVINHGGHGGGGDTTEHGGGKDTIEHGGGRDSIHHRDTVRHDDRGHNGNHIRFDIGRLLHNDSCRQALELLMTPDDAHALEANLAKLKADGDQITALRTQLKAAREAHDTATLRMLWGQVRMIMQDVGMTNKAVSDILGKYRDAITATLKDCGAHKGPHRDPNGGGTTGELRLEVKPIFPNPVSLRSAQAMSASLMYSLSADADVNITLMDATGTIINQIANDHETMGMHTAVINVAGLQAGMYLVRIQAGSVVQTQKLVIVL